MNQNKIIEHRELGLCVNCVIQPLSSAAKVFGIDVTRPCREATNSREYLSWLYRFYLIIVEVILWGTSAALILNLKFNFPCICWTRRFGKDALSFLLSSLGCILTFYLSFQFSCLKRSKLSLMLPKSGYEGEEKLSKKIDTYVLKAGLYTFTLITITSLSASLFVYSVLSSSEPEAIALVCTVLCVQGGIYALGQIFSVFLMLSILGIIIHQRYKHLSFELKYTSPFLHSSAHWKWLEHWMDKHTELWEFFQDFNKLYKDLTPIVYGNFVFSTCLFLYSALFLPMNRYMRAFQAMVGLVCFVGSVLVSWEISAITLVMYDDFPSIVKFSAARFSVNQKLKVLCFAKRFGKMPMGISFADFFYAKRQFVIRFLSGMYSVTSTLLDLTQPQKKNACYDSVTANGTSVNI